MKLLFGLACLMASLAHATDIRFEYYFWDDTAQRFEFSPEGKRVRWGVYLCVAYNEKGQWRQFWVTRGDDNHIVPGSIVLGNRLNKPSKEGAAVYYRLEKNLGWYALNPTTRPVVRKYNPEWQDCYLAEEPLEDWEAGHTLYEGDVATKVPMLLIHPNKPAETVPVKPRPTEPPPRKPRPAPIAPPSQTPEAPPRPPALPKPRPPELGCEIEVTPPRIPVGGSAILTMRSYGPVDSATLDGAAVDFPRVLRAKAGEKIGELLIKGEVTARKEKRTCEAKLTVEKN